MKLARLIICISVSSFSTAAFAECTVESVQDAAVQISTEAQTLAATDPAKMQEVMMKLQEAGTAFQESGSLEDACKMYDEILAELKG